MTIDWDIIKGATVKRTRTTLEIVRPVMVSDIGIDCTDGLTNPSVLLAAMSVLPSIGSVHHDPLYPALLDEYAVSSVESSSAVIIDLIYRLNLTLGNPGDPNMWIKTVANQSYQTETYTTSGGTTGLIVYYKQGQGTGTQVPPANSTAIRIGKARRTRVYKVLKVMGRMYYNKWLEYAPTIEAAEECINSDTWGASTRGQWLCLGPTVSVPLPTNGQDPDTLIASVEVNFIKDKMGHFPLLAYLNERREHPKDTVTEANLRAAGLPAVDGLRIRNGKTLASIYPEVTFSDKFIFTP